MTDDERWAQFERCLHDSEMPLDVRGAGALTLLYGLPLSRIVEIRAGDLVADDQGRFLMLNGHPLPLPPALAILLDQLASDLISPSVVGRVGGTHLFPSWLAGRAVNAGRLSAKLREYGLPGIRGRNSALLALATRMPAATLSETFGISITSAVQWTKRSKRDWHAYIAAARAGSARRVSD